MIKVSKMADYAVVVLSTLARSDDALMTAGNVSGKTGLPEPTVAKILKLLSRERILESVRGANGGYRLLAVPEQISVAQIISAVDGPISLTSCVEGGEGGCGYESHCAVRGRWNGVNHAIRDALARVSLADMLNYECAGATKIEDAVIEVKI